MLEIGGIHSILTFPTAQISLQNLAIALTIPGPNTMEQSCNAAAIDGVIAIIGTRGGQSAGSLLPHTALVQTRRIIIGSRLQFEEMNRAIEVNQIKPVIDEKVFGFEEAHEAFQYLWDQKAVGKVVIDVD